MKYILGIDIRYSNIKMAFGRTGNTLIPILLIACAAMKLRNEREKNPLQYQTMRIQLLTLLGLILARIRFQVLSRKIVSYEIGEKKMIDCSNRGNPPNNPATAPFLGGVD